VKFGVDSLQIGDSHRLSKNHLVERGNEVCVQESPMEDGETNDAADELEVTEMVWVDSRCRIDLQGIIVVRRVLEQSVTRVEDLVR